MKGCILVVEDNPDLRFILSLRLKRAGFEVVTAEHGRAGLRLLREANPRAVLLDLMMPEMDGFEFLAALGRSRRPAPPVFVVSQRDDSETRERVRQMGARAFFTKDTALQREFAGGLARLLLGQDYESPASPSSGALPAAA
jgi:two-component system KDP operon response regulator KdpE